MNYFDKILDILKLILTSIKVNLALLISSSILLFLPQYLTLIKINQVTSRYGELIVIVWVFSLAMLIANLGIFLNHKVSKYFRSEAWKKRKIKRAIQLLTPYQKAILREFFIQKSRSILVPVNNPDVSILIKKEILESHGVLQANLPIGIIKFVEISFYAEKLLDSKSIGWPEDSTGNEMKLLMESRPTFISVIENSRLGYG